MSEDLTLPLAVINDVKTPYGVFHCKQCEAQVKRAVSITKPGCKVCANSCKQKCIQGCLCFYPNWHLIWMHYRKGNQYNFIDQAECFSCRYINSKILKAFPKDSLKVGGLF